MKKREIQQNYKAFGLTNFKNGVAVTDLGSLGGASLSLSVFINNMSYHPNESAASALA